MNLLNRFFVSLFALAWLAILAICGWLVWDSARSIDESGSLLEFSFDIIADTRAEQILASIVLGLLAVPALLLLALQFRRSRTRQAAGEDEENVRLRNRVDELEKRLDEERKASRPAPAPVQSTATRADDRSEGTEPEEQKRDGGRRWRLLPRGHH